VARTYRAFARREARGRSAAYESLAESVAANAAVAGFVASLPPGKRQPNLVFAAARYLLGVPPAIGPLRELVSQSPAELTRVILARRTQTNEPARCAVLLPALAQLYRTSVLWYVAPARREQFARTVRRLGAAWLSSEPPGVVPGTSGPARDGQQCVLARDGHPIALADSHATWLQWLP
jgi:hypothetical protein